jgi:hypothetical protein
MIRAIETTYKKYGRQPLSLENPQRRIKSNNLCSIRKAKEEELIQFDNNVPSIVIVKSIQTSSRYC